MVTEIDCYENVSNNNNLCENIYYVCSFDCLMSLSFLCLALLFCCMLGYYNKIRYRRTSGGIYANLYTENLEPENLYTEKEFEDDQGLIMRGYNIYNQPPKYSEN